MPNLFVRFARCVMRSRKSSSSSIQSPNPSRNAVQNPNLSPENKTTVSSPQLDSSRSSPSSVENTIKTNENKNELDSRETKKTQNSNEIVSREEDLSTKKSKPVSKDFAKPSTNQKINYGNGQSASVRSRRVLRELQNMMKVSAQPNSAFEVSLVDDSDIFEWDVRLRRVDEFSDLWRSMQDTGTEYIRFRLSFPELFPFQPPFLRLTGPYLDNGFIMDGGAICMEVLTSQGWSSAYTIESLLIQVSSGLTQGGAVVSRRQKRRYNQLSQIRAEAEFRRICKIHAKYGWVSMEKEEV